MTCSPAPKTATSSTPGSAFTIRMAAQQIGRIELQQLMRVQLLLERSGHAQGDQLAAVNQRQAMAILGLIHVMGGDQDGLAGFGELINQIPEAAPRNGIHARGGLVQKQDARRMHDGAAERQALLPAARPAAASGWCAGR